MHITANGVHWAATGRTMNNTTRQAFVATIPVMTGYLALGFGFGIMLKASGFPVWLAPVMSITMYAGAMQYVAVGLLSSGPPCSRWGSPPSW